MNALDHSEFEKYQVEATEKWGKTDAYREHAEITKNYGKEKWNGLAAEMERIMEAFAVCMKNDESPEKPKRSGL